MQTEKSKDLALGVFILAIAIGGFLFVNPADAPVTKGVGGISWRTLPFAYSGLLLICACLFLGLTALQGNGAESSKTEINTGDTAPDTDVEPPESTVFGFKLSALRRLLVVAILVVYSQALSAFGFAISTPVFLFAVLFIFGKINVRENFLVSTIGGLVLWLLFSYFLRMPLSGALWDPVTPALNHLLRAMGA